MPATPTNTPQTSYEIPQRTRGGAEFSTAKPFAVTKLLNIRGSVPPTPANTPQRSGELPSSISSKFPDRSPLSSQPR